MMREDWVKVKLESVCSITMGQSPPSSTYNTDGDGLPFFQGKLDFTNLYPIVNKWCTAPKKIAKPFDVLLSVRAPVGSTNIAKTKCAIGRGLAAITYKPAYKYVWYFLKLIEKQLDQQGTGTTFKSISGLTLKSQLIPIAPLPEQRAIVAKIETLFSKLDNGIANLKEAKDKLEVYRQAVLKKAFEGAFSSKPLRYCRLGEYASIISGHAFKKSEYTTEGVPLFQIANVSFNKIKWDKIAFLPISYLSDKKLSNLILKEGDIVVALNRPMLNNKLKIGQLAKIDTPAILYQRVGKFILNKDLNSKYLLYYLQSPEFTKWLSEELRGVNIPFINQTKLLNYDLFPITEMREQEQIVQEIETRLSVCDNIQANIDEGLKRAETLRQSILKKAFEGRLLNEKELEDCRKEPDWEPADKLLERIKKSKEEDA